MSLQVACTTDPIFEKKAIQYFLYKYLLVNFSNIQCKHKQLINEMLFWQLQKLHYVIFLKIIYY